MLSALKELPEWQEQVKTGSFLEMLKKAEIYLELEHTRRRYHTTGTKEGKSTQETTAGSSTGDAGSIGGAWVTPWQKREPGPAPIREAWGARQTTERQTQAPGQARQLEASGLLTQQQETAPILGPEQEALTSKPSREAQAKAAAPTQEALGAVSAAAGQLQTLRVT